MRGEPLEVGELLVAVRYLARRWCWSKSRAHRFLANLESMTRIGTVRETENGTVYRVVNYELHGGPRDGERDGSGTAAGQSIQLNHSTIHTDEGRGPSFSKLMGLVRTELHLGLYDGELGIDAQVLAFVERHPGASQRAVREHVRSNAEQVRQAIHRLIRSREIEDRGDERGMRLHRADKWLETATEPPQNHPGTGSRNHGARVVPEGGDPRRGSPSEPPLGTAIGPVVLR